jgi:hypothetical protein
MHDERNTHADVHRMLSACILHNAHTLLIRLFQREDINIMCIIIAINVEIHVILYF